MKQPDSSGLQMFLLAIREACPSRHNWVEISRSFLNPSEQYCRGVTAGSGGLTRAPRGGSVTIDFCKNSRPVFCMETSRRTAVRETSSSRHHRGTICAPPEDPKAINAPLKPFEPMGFAGGLELVPHYAAKTSQKGFIILQDVSNQWGVRCSRSFEHSRYSSVWHRGVSGAKAIFKHL